MSFGSWVRQIHRWLSIAFVVSVLGYIVVMSRGPVPGWANIFPAGSLILMLATGLYLFVLPYLPRRRGRA
jgi:hypothetical protein